MEADILLIPIRVVTLFIKEKSSLKSEMDFLKAPIGPRFLGGLSLSGITLIVIVLVVTRRRMISIANRVQRLSFRRKGISVKASRTEFLPAD